MATLTVGLSGYLNIEVAIDAASQGDTIELSPGYSGETVTVTKSDITIVGGSSSQNIVLVIGDGVSGLVLSGEAPINVTDSDGDDTVSGNNGDNVITVTGGIDVVAGGLGTDRLVVDYSATSAAVTGTATTISSDQGTVNVIGSSIEHYTVSTGSGIDTLTFLDGDNYIDAGTTGGNTITVGSGDNTIISGSGIDGIIAGTGNNYIEGGDGANTITVGPTGSGNNIIYSGSGIDAIIVGNGNNFVDAGTGGANTITVGPSGSGNNTIISGTGIDTISVGNGDNYIDAGTGGANTITVGPTGFGNNTIISGSGIDGIITGNGDNYIDAGTTGANTITVGSGNNTIISGSGIDGIIAGTGNNYIEGGDGANTITAGPTGFGNNIIVSGSGIDTISVGNGDNCIDAGTGGANTITVGSGNNTIISGSGIDGFTVGNGNNYIEGGEGANTIAVGNGNNTIISGSGIDTITAGNGSNNIEGGEGANAITTGTGNDVVSSGISADTIVTGAGNDIIKDAGGAGAVTAGAGHDRLIMDFSTATTAVTNTVTGADSHGGVLGGTTYTGVEEFHITTGSGNDTLLGGDGADVLDGGAGADSLSAGSGSDVIYGGLGDVVDGGENLDGSDFDVLVLEDFGNHRIDLDSLLDPENGTVVQLDGDGNETGSVAFTGIESIEFVDTTVTTPEDTILEGTLFTAVATTTVANFVVGSTTYVAGQTAARTEGDLTINSGGSYTFIPAPNYYGPGPVTTYTTVDTLNPLSSGTFSFKIDVEPVDEVRPVCAPDTTATDAPTVTITEDTNDDDLISGGELSGQVDVKITLPAGAVAGDTLTVTNLNALKINAVSEADIDAGEVIVTYDAPADGETITVSAVITDAAGNTSEAGSDSATLDLAAVGAVTLDANITADDVINAAEAAETIAITGTTAGEVAAGDTVTLTVDGSLYTGPVAADGRFSIDVLGGDLATDPDLRIDAIVSFTDAAGNPGTASDTETYTVDVAAAGAVTLDTDITPDDVINAAEAAETIAITGTTAGDVSAGDTVTLMVNEVAFFGDVAGDGRFSIDVLGSTLAADPDLRIDASVSFTDAAGNPGTASDTETYTVDVAAAGAVTLDTDITPDDVINAAEAAETIAITGTTAGEVAAGDTVTLTVDGSLYTGPVAADGRFSIDVLGGDLATDPDLRIDAIISFTDAAGNPGTASDTETYTVDVAAAAPTVTITEDTNDDGLISNAELWDTDSAQINVTIELPTDAVAGDTVTSTNPDTPPTDVELSEADIEAGEVIVTYDAPADGDTITVSAVITDAAGNTSATSSDSAGVICFTEGTLITTEFGEIPIEDLKVGDLIQTLDSGLQPLRWIGRRYLDARELAGNDNLRPIRISQNVIGSENCDRDLVVSPQHRILIASRVAERMFGNAEVIVAVKHLLAIEGVDIASDLNHVTYFHILLDEHAIVYANKFLAESLYLGRQAQLSLSQASRAEVLALFPELASPSFIPTSCRPIICNQKARKLAERHIKNNRPIIRSQNGGHQFRLPRPSSSDGEHGLVVA
jgi:Ca2+-binding RTX toxin-like protein/phage FluMu protein gp41